MSCFAWPEPRNYPFAFLQAPSTLLFDASGTPTGEYEDFMTGFVVSNTEVWGRPVGVAVANDGSLVVTEDGNGTIWRFAYQGSARSR